MALTITGELFFEFQHKVDKNRDLFANPLIHDQLNDFSISFIPDRDLHCSCSKKTTERLKSLTPRLNYWMEGTSEERNSDLLNQIDFKKKVQHDQFETKEGVREIVQIVCISEVHGLYARGRHRSVCKKTIVTCRSSSYRCVKGLVEFWKYIKV